MEWGRARPMEWKSRYICDHNKADREFRYGLHSIGMADKELRDSPCIL